MLFQIILVAFAASVIVRVYAQYRARRVSVGWFWLWVLFWTVVILVALSPETTNRLAELVGVGRGADLVVYTALATLFFSVYKIFMRLEEQNRQLTDLVRAAAIAEAEREIQK